MRQRSSLACADVLPYVGHVPAVPELKVGMLIALDMGLTYTRRSMQPDG